MNPDAKDWESLFPAGGAYGITGEPRLQLNWTLIGFKLLGASIVIYSVIGLSFVVRRFSRKSA